VWILQITAGCLCLLQIVRVLTGRQLSNLERIGIVFVMDLQNLHDVNLMYDLAVFLIQITCHHLKGRPRIRVQVRPIWTVCEAQSTDVGIHLAFHLERKWRYTETEKRRPVCNDCYQDT
jgi:hypothetical protein